MSSYSNQGPLRRMANSQSQTSLYSENSEHSDSPKNKLLKQQSSQKQKLSTKQMPLINVNPPLPSKVQQTIPTVPPQKSAAKLPQIKSYTSKNQSGKMEKMFNNSFVNDAAERHALFNEKLTSVQIAEEKAPKANFFYSKSQSKGEKSLKRYGYSQIVTEDGKDLRRNAIGSSQGSRWIKSQSLNVSREQKSFKFLVRHFHRHNSILLEALNRFWESFENAERFLTVSNYKLSLYDSLDNIKLKMESFLERRINLENFDAQKPTAEWTQEQFMRFYGNYRRILITETETKEEHRPFTLKKYKNCVFFGKMNDGKKIEGVLHYFNGKCFEGKFKDDQKQFGLQIDQKQLYLGQFKKGVWHGQGILKTAEALHVGTFTYGQFSTVTQQKDESGTSSLFANHPPDNSGILNKKGFQISHSTIKCYDSGLCVIKNTGGDIFIGVLGEEGEKHEEGLQIFANGDIYIGRYQSDSPEGYGEYYWENGSHYRGQFLSGMRHGRGVWQMVNGDFYEGEYMNDKKNGKGTYLWKNGSKYIGNFENDYRHGYGEMYWQDGRVYKGKWLNGIEKNTLISLQKPNAKPSTVAHGKIRPSFRTIQHDNANRKKIPLDKLKSLYNPSYH